MKKGVMHSKKWGYLFGLTASLNALPAMAADNDRCGKAQILAGDLSSGDGTCPDLRVRFDLTGCGGEGTPSKPVYQCSRGKGAVEIESGGYRYRVPLLETWAGSWVISDDVTREAVKKDAAPAVSVAPVPTPTPASLLSLVSSKGVARVRSETFDMTDASSHRSYTHLRVRTDFTFVPDPAVSLFFQPQFTKILGEVGYPGSSATANAATDTSGNGYDTAFTVHQARLDFRVGENGTFMLGRQVLAYGNELVIGAADWGIVGRSFDAARVRFKSEKGATDFFASKIEDNNTTATATVGDRDFYGAYQTLNLGSAFKQVDFYALYLRDATQKLAQFSTVNVTPTNLWTVGARTQSTLGIFDDRVEVTKQWLTYSGPDADGTTGFQANAELGATLPTSVRPRLALEGYYASKNYNQLFTTPHKFLGYADVVGRRNLSGFAVHGSVQPSDVIKMTFDYYSFSRADTDVSAFKKGNTNLALGSGAANQSADIGHEFNFVVDYASSKAVNFYGGVALFYTGDYLRPQLNRKLLDFYYAGFDLRF